MEDNPITGVSYRTVEVKSYNDTTKRRIDRYNNSRNKYRRITHTKHIRQK